MGGKQPGYKGVEAQDLDREDDYTPISSKTNPYRLAGQAKISHSGESLSIKIKEKDNSERFFTILLNDIFRMNEEFKTGRFSTSSVREYENSPKSS